MKIKPFSKPIWSGALRSMERIKIACPLTNSSKLMGSARDQQAAIGRKGVQVGVEFRKDARRLLGIQIFFNAASGCLIAGENSAQPGVGRCAVNDIAEIPGLRRI